MATSESQRIDLSRLWNGPTGAGNLQDEFMSSLRETGLEGLATQTDLVQNGDLVSLRGYRPPAAAPAVVPSPPTAGSAPDTQEKRQYRKRKPGNEEEDDIGEAEKKSRGGGRGGDRGAKGLRHFSRQVCDKVQQKGTTTYNEVADDLVQDFVQANKEEFGDSGGDHKNIRRRVYDALNVLMAMKIIAKEKKEIRWLGLPPDAEDEANRLKRQKADIEQKIARKQTVIQDLNAQQTSISSLLERNRQPPFALMEARIHLPFIIVHTSQQTVIDCLMTEDRTEIMFDFSQPFEIHDDNEILRRMDLSVPAASALADASAAVVPQFGTPRRPSTTPPPPSPMRITTIPLTPPPQTPPSLAATAAANALLMSPLSTTTPLRFQADFTSPNGLLKTPGSTTKGRKLIMGMSPVNV